MNNKNPLRIFLDHTGVYLPGARFRGDRTADPPDRPVLYGNCVLLCQKFKEAP